jgi:osmotically-inducible protein OsmY
MNWRSARQIRTSARTKDIARAAVDTLKWSVFVPSSRIKVKVSKGWVTLEGAVDWEFQKNAAEKAVRKLTGIRRNQQSRGG